MRYDDFRRSDNIDDRRDDSGYGGGGGGGFGFPMGGGGGLGIGTVIVLGLIGWAVGIDPRILIGGAEILTGGQQAPTYQTDRRTGSPPKAGAPTDEMGSMIAGVLGEIDDRWSEIFSASGQTYRGPRIVLFRNATNGGRCGMAQSAMGPFYCPADRKVYLDLSFWNELESRFGAKGEFARAYVISHEIGHHIQNQMGATRKADSLGRRGAESGSVRLELQADCYAGVWARHAPEVSNIRITRADIEDGLGAAAAVGDDAIQSKAQGRVMPDSFTHGTSEQRMRWFGKGYDDGRPAACDTFATDDL